MRDSFAHLQRISVTDQRHLQIDCDHLCDPAATSTIALQLCAITIHD